MPPPRSTGCRVSIRKRGIQIEHATIEGANHFFENRVDQLIEEVGRYLDRRLDNPVLLPTPARSK